MPLFWSAAAQHFRVFDKAPHTSRAVATNIFEFLGDVAVAPFAACVVQDRQTGFGKRVDTVRGIPDAVVNVVSVLVWDS